VHLFIVSKVKDVISFNEFIAEVFEARIHEMEDSRERNEEILEK
jgi:hypothetical protein